MPEGQGAARGLAITAAILLSLLAAGAVLVVALELGRRPAEGDVQLSDVDRLGSGVAADAFPFIAIEPSQLDGMQAANVPEFAPGSDRAADTDPDRTPKGAPDTALHAMPVAAGASAAAGAAPAAGIIMSLPAPSSPAAGVQTAPGTAAPATNGAVDPTLLMERGNALLARADVSSARLFFRLAAEQGRADGAMAMAATYDPQKLTGAETGSARPDARAAIEWYRRAAQLGDRDADARVARLIDALGRRAAGGDAEARATLDAIGR